MSEIPRNEPEKSKFINKVPGMRPFVEMLQGAAQDMGLNKPVRVVRDVDEVPDYNLRNPYRF